MVSGTLLVLLLMLLTCPYATYTCGPGFTTVKPGSNFYVKSRQPDVPEDSVSASGKFEHALKMNDNRLVRISSTQIEFKTKKRDAKCRMTTKVISLFLSKIRPFEIWRVERGDGKYLRTNYWYVVGLVQRITRVLIF